MIEITIITMVKRLSIILQRQRTSFEGIERSQFNTSYLFETSPEPQKRWSGK